jgi:uncharacterized membrane protein YciS (DUF1049 family)
VFLSILFQYLYFVNWLVLLLMYEKSLISLADVERDVMPTLLPCETSFERKATRQAEGVCTEHIFKV